MPNLWRIKMAEQRYNYLDRSIQEISDFLETRVENLQTPAPPPAVRSPHEKMKNSKKQKAVYFEESDKDYSNNKKLPSKKECCQYHGNCGHSTGECTTLKALIKKAKSKQSKGYKEDNKKTYTKHEVNVLIKLKKDFKGKKKHKQELHTFERIDVSESKESAQAIDVSNLPSKSNDS